MNRLTKYISKKNIILLFIALIIVVFSILPQKEKAYIKHYEDNNAFENPIETETTIEDKFCAKTNSDGIAIVIGTYMKVLEKGKLFVTILDNQTNENVFSDEIPFSNISDGGCLDFKCKILKEHTYTVKINVYDIDCNNMIVFSKAKSEKNETYIVNNEVQSGNLNISYISSNKYYGNIWMLVLAIAVIYYIIIDNRGVKYE